MSNKNSKLWSIALLLSLVLLAAAYYIKVSEFRKFVDQRTPLARQYLGSWVQEPVVKIEWKGEQDPLFARAKATPSARPPIATPSPAKIAVASPGATPVPEALPVAPSPAPANPAADLQKIASNRALWPKTLTLTQPATFPAVFEGKIVGSLVAPAGAEVILHSIKDGKVGLEFNGGGAWLPAEQTDLLAKVPAPQ